jgi:PQQ-like domain
MVTRCALAVGIAALAVACSDRSGTTRSAGVPTATAPMVVGCDQIIDRTKTPFAGGYRRVLGVVAAPPAHIPQVVRSDDPHWPYWEKAGMVLRAGPRPIDVSVPANWRGRAAITWGNGRPPVSAIRFTPCPSPPGVWNAYAGGFLMKTRGACVPLVFQVGRERRVVRFGVGVRCEEQASAAAWPIFGSTSDRANSSAAPTGITAANAGSLTRTTIDVPGAVDSSPIFAGGRFVVTTSYGKTLALDRDGHVLWTYTPPGIDGWEGSAQITNASPAADPDGEHVYAVSPDGAVHKLDLADGTEVTGGGWPVTITRDPTHEKLGTALNISGDLVLATTGGYIGDAPPYQGHVVSIDRASGRIVHVWNALCSDRQEIIEPSTCADSDAAIWARAGAVVEPDTGRILVATGNGPYDGRTAWGDSVLELSPDAGRLVGSWTPPNQEELSSGDVDLGSTAPALVRGADGRLYGVQGGKDGLLRLIDIERMHVVQTLPDPGATAMFTAPAVAGRNVFIATGAGTAAYRLVEGTPPALVRVWENDTPGTSPILAGGLLYVYDPTGGGINVYRPGSSSPVATLPADAGHWQSPIAISGRVLIGEGDANEHATSGRLSLYRLP